MKNILMIGTGGTIASKQTEYGLAPGLSTEDILNYIPAVSKICEVDSIQVCNLDSTNVTPEHWKLLVKRPVIVDGDTVFTGFKAAEWEEKLL